VRFLQRHLDDDSATRWKCFFIWPFCAILSFISDAITLLRGEGTMAKLVTIEDDVTLEEAVQIRDSFRRIWIVAICVSVIFVVPVMMLKDQAPWVIGIPIVVGIVIGVAIEIRSDRAARMNVEPLPGDYVGLRQLCKKFEVQIGKWKEQINQEIFDFLPDQKAAAKKIRKVKTDTGDEICVVNGSTFIDILVSRLLEDSDKIVELTMLLEAKRFEAKGSNRPVFFSGSDLEIIKNVSEVIGSRRFRVMAKRCFGSYRKA
jgi:hypothetical protein